MPFIHKSMCVGLVAVTILGVFLAGCSPRAETGSRSTGLEGTITVSGAFALYPIMIRWGEEFGTLHPGVTFDISAGGAGKGMADTLSGAVDIGMVSRPVFEEEIEKGAFWVAVAKDAVVVTVNTRNPVVDQLLAQGLSRETAEAIWITADITTWSRLVGGGDEDAIHVYTRADACGAAQTWAQYLGDYSQEDLQGIGVQADPGVAEAVSKDALAIGYNNLNFAYDAKTGKPVHGIRVVPLDVDESGKIDPREGFCENKVDLMQAITDGRYPSPPSRALHLVTKGQPQGLVSDFIQWVMTDGQSYLDEVGYVQLSQEQLDEGLSKLR
jgi:phosphate transport system substrate-binding protein